MTCIWKSLWCKCTLHSDLRLFDSFPVPKKSNIPESGDAGDALEYEDESCSRIIDQETLNKFTMTKYGGEVKSVEKRKMELDAAKKRASPEKGKIQYCIHLMVNYTDH